MQVLQKLFTYVLEIMTNGYPSGSQPFLVGGTLHIQINFAAHL